MEGSWKSGGVRDLSSGSCLCQRRSLPLGTCSPLQGPAPPATRGLPCLQERLCPRLCVQSSSRALGAELFGSGRRPDSGSGVPGEPAVPMPGSDVSLGEADLCGSQFGVPQAGPSLLVVSGSGGFRTQTSSGGPDLCPVSRAVRAPRAPACGGVFVRPPSLSEGPKKLVACGRPPPRATPTLPGHACRGCERPLPDPEVDHAQAEKEVAQAAPRFPVHSPRWPPGPRAGLC